jgi:hypothetical protein
MQRIIYYTYVSVNGLNFIQQQVLCRPTDSNTVLIGIITSILNTHAHTYTKM